MTWTRLISGTQFKSFLLNCVYSECFFSSLGIYQEIFFQVLWMDFFLNSLLWKLCKYVFILSVLPFSTEDKNMYIKMSGEGYVWTSESIFPKCHQCANDTQLYFFLSHKHTPTHRHINTSSIILCKVGFLNLKLLHQ